MRRVVIASPVLCCWKLPPYDVQCYHAPAPPLFCFPRPCRFSKGWGWLVRYHLFQRETLIGEPPSGNRTDNARKSCPIHTLPLIKPEALFIQISEQMKRFNTDIGPFDGPLQEAPEILDAVGMHGVFHLGFGMIYQLVNIRRV